MLFRLKLNSIFLISMLIIGVSCAHFSNITGRNPTSERLPLHFVFDIDWTLVTPLKDGSQKPFINSGRLYEVDGHYYLMKEGMRELIELALEKNIPISFFSGGKKSRNINLLKKIKLTNGETLYSRATKVLSFQDLTEVSTDIRLRFSERYRKDMAKIHPKLEEVILLEDIPHFAKGQGMRQTAWLGETRFPKLPGKSLSESQEYWRKFEVEERFLPQSLKQDWWEKRKVFLLIKELESGKIEAQEILSAISDWGFSEETPPSSITKHLMSSPLYQKFLKRRPCPQLRFN